MNQINMQYSETISNFSKLNFKEYEANMTYPNQMESSFDLDVLIIGSGISGLSTANLLINKGFRVAIMEESSLSEYDFKKNLGFEPKEDNTIYSRKIALDIIENTVPLYLWENIEDPIKYVNILSISNKNQGCLFFESTKVLTISNYQSSYVLNTSHGKISTKFIIKISQIKERHLEFKNSNIYQELSVNLCKINNTFISLEINDSFDVVKLILSSIVAKNLIEESSSLLMEMKENFNFLIEGPSCNFLNMAVIQLIKN